MTRYEIIINLKKTSNFTQLVASSIISISIPTWLQIYETYLEQLNSEEKTVAIQFTADCYSVTERTIYKVLEFMEC